MRKLDLKAIHQRFFFENDMLAQLGLWDARVKDVGIPAKYGSEISSLNPMKILVTFPQLLLSRGLSRFWQKYVVRDFSPVALFLVLGLLLMTWGFAFGSYSWIKSAMTGHVTTTGTVMLSVLPFILGFQLFLQAIVLDISRSPK